ncbi:ovalbumin-related protein X-like isoform X2 [Belonocnema kinseyi]|uniref:ovalbumin-related protein X-like isoform X2 n=1 Tax=Belonocnema kinseyi TaxID=2817044 RepID=UPI00143D65EF|nr:ovalbumin-related protein X-like isoform X2 [Belonocnema kinseyi]
MEECGWHVTLGKFLTILFEAALVFLLLIFEFSFDATMEINQDSRSYEDACSSVRNFSNLCYKILTLEEENSAYSPLSLHLILSLLSHGARKGTASVLKTRLFHPETDMLTGFKYLISSLINLTDLEFNVANTIYIQDEIQLIPEFVLTSAEIFGADVSHVNFKEALNTVKQINSWVATKTGNKIQDIITLDDIHEDTRIVIINAIYFKSFWLNKFDAHVTTTQDFRNIHNKVKHVSMMFKSSNFSHGILKEFNTRVLEIPYKNQDFKMMILLPNDVDGLRSLEQKLDWNAISNVHLRRSKVELFLPKFKVDVKLDLKPSLEKMGMSTIFRDEADFSGISKTPLKVSQVVQKVFIEVDEEGSEAAVATGVQMRLRRCLSEDPEEFRVDRPFIFVIYCKPANVPLFFGSVRDIGVPAKKDEL